METIEGHGGDVALAALRASGVEEMFTLSGGHVFPLYDAAVRQKVRIVDVRHEQSAVFAAEGGGQADPPARAGGAHRRARRHQRRLRRDHGLLQRRRRWSCSAAGRRRSAGVAAACRRSTTCRSSPRSPSTPRRSATADEIGPVLLDAARDGADPAPRAGLPRPAAGRDLLAGRRRDRVRRADRRRSSRTRTRSPRRPALVAAGAAAGDHRRLRRLRRATPRPRCGEAAEALQVPVFTNGMGRGCLPADAPAGVRPGPRAAASGGRRGRRGRHPAGLPARLRRLRRRPGRARRRRGRAGSRRTGRWPVARPATCAAILDGLADYTGDRADHEPWLDRLRAAEDAARAADAASCSPAADP